MPIPSYNILEPLCIPSQSELQVRGYGIVLSKQSSAWIKLAFKPECRGGPKRQTSQRGDMKAAYLETRRLNAIETWSRFSLYILCRFATHHDSPRFISSQVYSLYETSTPTFPKKNNSTKFEFARLAAIPRVFEHGSRLLHDAHIGDLLNA